MVQECKKLTHEAGSTLLCMVWLQIAIYIYICIYVYIIIYTGYL